MQAFQSMLTEKQDTNYLPTSYFEYIDYRVGNYFKAELYKIDRSQKHCLITVPEVKLC